MDPRGGVWLWSALARVGAAQTPQDSATLLVQEAEFQSQQGKRDGLERSIPLLNRAAALLHRAAALSPRTLQGQASLADTTRLKKSFCAHWLRDPDRPSKPVALRRAQLELAHNPRFAAPVLGRFPIGGRPLTRGAGVLLALAAARFVGCVTPLSAMQIPQDSALQLAQHALVAAQGGTRAGLERAIALWTQSAARFALAGDRRDAGIMLNQIGWAHSALGRPDSALAYYRRALAIARAVANAGGEAAILNNIGYVESVLGRPDSALAYFRQGLVLVSRAGTLMDQGTSLTNIGVAYRALGQLDSALEYDRRSLAVARYAHDTAGEGRVLNNIGNVHKMLGRLDSAVAYFRQALAVRREARDRKGEGTTLNNIGWAHQALGRPDSAVAYFEQALASERAAGDRAAEGMTLANLGWVFHRDRSPPDLATATAYYDSAAAVERTVGAHAGGESNRVSFAEQDTLLFEMWVLACLARAPADAPERGIMAALGAAERGRAQALAALMRGTHGSDPLEPSAADLLASAVPPHSALLFYVVTRDTLLAFLAAPGRAPSVSRHVVSRDSLGRLVTRWRAELGVAESRARPLMAGRDAAPLDVTRSVPVAIAIAGSGGVVGRALASLLIPPTLTDGRGAVTDIIIVPHGVLGLVPFAALPVGAARQPLAARFGLRFAPSLTTLIAAARRPAPAGPRAAALRGAVVVGNPLMPTVISATGDTVRLSSLPGAEHEAAWVARRLGSRLLSGVAASEHAVRARWGAAPLIHLATHGYAYAGEALARQSFIALAPDGDDDGLVTVGEILDDTTLTLPADLVVLSACQSGLGDLKQAEGTIGLQRAFLAKGARSVLVSLWSVSDAATEELMKHFYDHWLADRDSPDKAQALRRAQADVRRMPGFAQPKYWAAFQLVGAR